MGGAGREIHGLDEQQLHQKTDQGWKKVGRDRLRESRWWQKAACRERARTVTCCSRLEDRKRRNRCP